MQFNGVGREHSPEMHKITSCMHENHTQHQKTGASGAAGAGLNAQPARSSAEPEGQFSLSAWVERTLGNGKRLLRAVWGGNETASAGEAGDKCGEAQVLAQINESNAAERTDAGVMGQESPQADPSRNPHTPQIAAAATALTQSQTIQNNPYFSAVEDTGRKQETLWQKVRVKFKDIAGQLAGHLPGKFFSAQPGNSFQAKQEHSRKDMRRRSKFREDEVEIDCVLTDDSYLLDSYDRSGKYSKLSAKK